LICLQKTPRVALEHDIQVFEDFAYLMEEKNLKIMIITPKEITILLGLR
jgi:hypothetical protein